MLFQQLIQIDLETSDGVVNDCIERDRSVQSVQADGPHLLLADSNLERNEKNESLD